MVLVSIAKDALVDIDIAQGGIDGDAIKRSITIAGLGEIIRIAAGAEASTRAADVPTAGAGGYAIGGAAESGVAG